MARAKIGLQFDGWQDYMAKLDKLGGTAAMKKAVEKSLDESKEYVTPQIEKAIRESNLPAKGKYATGLTKESLDREKEVSWEGMTGSVKVGFDFSKSGMRSIMLMYGTPKMDPVKGLKSAIYGNKTKKAIKEIQQEVIEKEIKKIMRG